MKKTLLLLGVLTFWAALNAGQVSPKSSEVYLDKSGCLRIANELKFCGDTYLKRVNYKQDGKSWKCDSSSQDKASGLSVNTGKIIIADQEIQLPSAMLVQDGEYIMRVPVDAVSVADGIKVKFENEESIDGKSLSTFALGDNRIFALNSVFFSAGSGVAL